MVENLKKLRTNTNISQQQLADVIGVSQQSINKYENHGVEPDIATLIAIANYFSTSVDYLIGNTDIERKLENVQKYDLNDEMILSLGKIVYERKDAKTYIIQVEN